MVNGLPEGSSSCQDYSSQPGRRGPWRPASLLSLWVFSFRVCLRFRKQILRLEPDEHEVWWVLHFRKMFGQSFSRPLPSEGCTGSESISVQEETRPFCQQIDQQTVEGLHPARCWLTWYSHWTAPLDQQASTADVISITFYNTKI